MLWDAVCNEVSNGENNEVNAKKIAEKYVSGIQ